MKATKSTNSYYIKNREKILKYLKCKKCKKKVDRKYLKTGQHHKTEKCKKEYCFLNNIMYKDKKGNVWFKGKIVKNPFLITFD